MSVDIYVSMLNLQKFQAIERSNDRELLRKIKNDHEKDIIDRDEYFRNILSIEPYLPLNVAIEQIIFGQSYRKISPCFQYEHAAAIIADTMGEHLDTASFQECNRDFLEEVELLIRNGLSVANLPESGWPVMSTILERGPLLKIPMDPEMQLGTGYLTDKEVQKIAGVANKVDLEKVCLLATLSWSEDSLQAVKDYRRWLRIAEKKRLGLFFHC